MKWLLRNTAFYAFALFILPFIVSGVSIVGGLPTFLIGGFVLTIMLLIIKPVVNLISLPLNILTLGLFSALTNVVILYLLTVLVPNISVKAFIFEGITFAGFHIPKVSLNVFFAYILAAAVLSVIIGCITWLSNK
ncbi:MAG: phage holin family protein [Candidatus Levybacteria bacterium]|nr:phage holin family protein [Candidatus Levybacteria bacterium]